MIRNKILLPIANKLIDIRQHSVRIIRDGVQYEARYHRTCFLHDGEPITIRRILEKRKVYHIDYWDGGEKGKVWCEMFGWGPHMFYAKRRKEIENTVTKNLNHVIDMWLKYVVNSNKEDVNES